MTSAYASAAIDIDWPFDAPPPALRCPITGKVVVLGYDPASGEMSDEAEKPDWANIPTVLFHFIPEVGEFDFIRPELQKKIEEKRAEMGEEAEDLDDFEILTEFVEEIGTTPLIFCLNTSGMANGPITVSVHIGLDLATLLPDEYKDDD